MTAPETPQPGVPAPHAPAPAPLTPPTAPAGPTRTERMGAWFTMVGKRSLVVLIVAAVVLVAYWLAAAFLPRWWAQSVGNQVDGSISRGTAWGLFYGFVFSFVPVLIIGQARRPIFKGWKAKTVVVLIGLVFALPNWLTLWVVLGTNDAAHDAERTLAVMAPYFRAWVGVGAAIGVALGLFVVGTGVYLRRRKLALAKREAELTVREAALRSHPDAP